MIYEKLEEIFKDSFPNSEQVCIAVGLISEGKAKEIDRLARKYDIDIYLIVGIDMPTPNSALRALMKAESNNKNLKVHYYSEESFFHPKVFSEYNQKHTAVFLLQEHLFLRWKEVLPTRFFLSQIPLPHRTLLLSYYSKHKVHPGKFRCLL